MPDDKPGKSEETALVPAANASLDVMFQEERKRLSRVEWGVYGFYSAIAVAVTVALQAATEIVLPTSIGMVIVLFLAAVIRGMAKGTMRLLPWPTSERTPDVWAVMSDARILAYASVMEERVISLSRESKDEGIVEKLVKMREKLGEELKAYRSATRDLRTLQRKKVRRKRPPSRLTSSIDSMKKKQEAAEAAIQKLIDAYDELIATYIAKRHGDGDGDATKIVDDLLNSVGKKDDAAKEAEKEVEQLTEVVT